MLRGNVYIFEHTGYLNKYVMMEFFSLPQRHREEEAGEFVYNATVRNLNGTSNSLNF